MLRGLTEDHDVEDELSYITYVWCSVGGPRLGQPETILDESRHAVV